jgi:hypothetical protein
MLLDAGAASNMLARCRGCLEMDWLFLKADVAREQPTTHLFFQYRNLPIQGHHVILM